MTEKSEDQVSEQKPKRYKGIRARIGQNREDFFWSKVNKNGPNGCWIWTGFCNDLGYGHFWREQRPMKAHRVAMLFSGIELKEGLVCDHLCRNPPCVNPAHIEQVKQRVNIFRGSSYMKQRKESKFCKRGHDLSGKNVIWRAGDTRGCNACARVHQVNRGKMTNYWHTKLPKSYFTSAKEALGKIGGGK